jgi:hypothetical protein
LSSETQIFTTKLKEWLPHDRNWTDCWRGTRDGWTATTFHVRCDGKEPTLTIVKVVRNTINYIFGGYTTFTWAGGKF